MGTDYTRLINERLLRGEADYHGSDWIVGRFGQTVSVSYRFQPLRNLPVSSSSSCPGCI